MPPSTARLFDPAVKHIDVAEEVHHELGGRIVEHFGRRADLFDPRLVHHHHAVGHFQRFFLVVRHQHAGHVQFVVQAAQPVRAALAHLGVERSERFVQQQHLRLDGQRPGQRHALPLPAGQLRRIAVAEAVQLDQLQQLV